MIDFDALLDIQTHDTQADQITHRKATLPEREELAATKTQLSDLEAALEEAGGRRRDLSRQEKRFEDEAQLVEDKATSEKAKLYSGEVTAMKELQALETEIESLKRRQTQLEDEAIALMEQIEPVDQEIAKVEADIATVNAQISAIAEGLATAETEADTELARVVVERATLAESVSADVLATYEKVRVAQGGVAVAKLVGSTCDGCHLGLSAVELDRVKKASSDELLYHEECGRILVR